MDAGPDRGRGPRAGSLITTVPRTSWRHVATLAAWVLGAACGVVPQTPPSRTRMSQSEPAPAAEATYPTVRVLLGDSLSTVRQRSTLPVPDGAREPGDNVNLTTPAQLVYGPRDHALAFPPGLFLSLVPMAGHVVEIRSSPHLRALGLDEALALTERLNALAESAGWRRAQVIARSDSVRHALAELPPDAYYKQALVRWEYTNGDELYFSVQRTRSAGDVRSANAAFGTRVPERDQFLVDVYLTNGPVFERFAALDRARR